jgi:8-oxo-dGTP pyrophosphatase MutT (NUDIX family)
MSEGIEGVPRAPAPPPPWDAAVVVLYRHGPQGGEVYWLKREASLRFAGGFYAFPGGRVEGDDGSPGLLAAAARELFEETGVLKARGAERLEQGTLDELRRQVLAQTLPFSALLASHRLSLERADFLSAGRWVTPASLPIRFDARFFLVEAPQGQQAQVWKGELESGEWIRPSQALARWREGTALLHPPNLHVMQVMAAFTGA